MYKQLTVYKIAFLNILPAILLLLNSNQLYALWLKMSICLLNAAFLAIALRGLPRFLRRNNGRLFIGRKRTLLVLLSGMYILTALVSILNNVTAKSFFIAYAICTGLVLFVYLFQDVISFYVNRVFKKKKRIAVVGYDDNANKLAEKLRRKSSNSFISHLEYKTLKADSTNAEILSEYIEYAKKYKINEFYISVPTQVNSDVAVFAEAAEKHCIRVNFIPPQDSLKPGYYHLFYIGGLPILQRYREPLRRWHKQVIKRVFDVVVSGFVMVFILSWLMPIVSLLIKLESKGPVFFKQLRSGRDNNSFQCLKFRSMFANDASNMAQTTKDDTRITKVGAFLRRTSLDEFPQFLNVFMGDMSVVGPRPHMLYHTEHYSEQVDNYMARLFLKPGITGWAQINGYRGEIRNIELMKNRVEYDIWYMENWNIFFDIKIMFRTLKNILKGEENAY